MNKKLVGVLIAASQVQFGDLLVAQGLCIGGRIQEAGKKTGDKQKTLLSE